ncbi:response regulator [candidate division KSB1 bacterium]|nr:SpoIIE family protein phosphatase [candidate division KSB1 bacterium]RQV99733.1 MAG: response regulator [candidate division KSB1 bacterium]
MSAKILVVDDEPDLEHLVRQKFRRHIRDNEFEFVFAQNGVQALQCLQNDGTIDLVLTDINMPEMDGLTLLTKMKELHMPLLRSVIVSAYGDMENIRTAMNRGAYDFVIKPIDLADLEITINKSLDDLFKLKEAIQSRDQLVALHHELDIARTIQMSLLPKTFPDRFELDIYAEMTPAKEVGGDFYDFFLIDENRLGFSIGDVSGKGVPAALFMAVCKTVLKSTALKGLSPDECLHQVNRMLQLESVASMFVTVFYGILDISTGEIVYCNGGHLPPYKISKDGKANAIEITGNLVLGVFANASYQTKTIQLAPGDGLLLYTDGITEAMGPHNEEYGEERLNHSLQVPIKSAKETTQTLIDSVKNFSGGRAQSDDMTVLTLYYRS